MDRHFPLFPYAFMDGFIYLAQYSPAGSGPDPPLPDRELLKIISSRFYSFEFPGLGIQHKKFLISYRSTVSVG